ncbi:MAG: low molecular weight phosphotyrosine protein phosphatase [Myxococcales bacterium]|nr:low molecular weight phosphotyrosine protein phosphatase [Myxococcales bacterium]
MSPRVSVCFVCLGNICRSPTAEGVMRSLVVAAGLAERIAIDSSGTAAYHAGELPDARSRRAAEARGMRLEHRARQVTASDFERFDYLLAMDQDNLEILRERAPRAARAKLALLRSFDATAEPGACVPDPYYGGPSGFDDVLDMCERACAGLLEHLRKEHDLG